MRLILFFRFGYRIMVALMICLAASGSVVYGAAPVNADTLMEIVWAETDGLRHEIYVSSFASGSWADPVKITDDNADNLHPSIDVGSDGRKWVAWTAVEGETIEIRYSFFVNGVWQEQRKIPSGLTSSIKPSIIVDDTNIPLVVWSGNSGDNDDIYYSRFIDGKWIEEKRVHEPNEVPDILAFLYTDDDGTPIVIWDSFHGDSYRKVQSSWNGEMWSKPTAIREDQLDREEQSEVVLPEFISDPSQVFLRIYEPNIAKNL